MSKCRIIGRGYKPSDAKRQYPYDVMIVLDDPEWPIGLGEGSSHGSVGGSFTLQEMADPKWREHLEICGCDWLIDLAKAEKDRGRPFTPEEMFEKWKKI